MTRCRKCDEGERRGLPRWPACWSPARWVCQWCSNPPVRPQPAATSGGVKIAYFDQWSIYQNAFYLKNLDTEGIASKLNFLIYDFENIDPTNLTCFEDDQGDRPGSGR